MSTGLSLKEIVDSLLIALDEERRALQAAHYDALPALASEKERLAGRLDAMLLEPAHAAQFPAYRKKLATLARRAGENETLLASAKIGVSAAQARIKDLLNRQRNVGVYGLSGEKILAPDAAVTRQKFA